MVAFPDETLNKVHAQMESDYKNVKFKKVGVDLGKNRDYFEIIKREATPLKPNLIFNNAGFIVTGVPLCLLCFLSPFLLKSLLFVCLFVCSQLFADNVIEANMANYECNAIAPVLITHHFANELLNSKRKGAIFFTSSPAGELVFIKEEVDRAID
mgnify:CR=1 FL=1